MNSPKRYLIVGTGRSGSSLLGAIIASAGGEAAMGAVGSWDPRGGEYEHPALLRAETWRARADKIRRSLVPDRLAAYCEERMNRELTKLLEQANFVKSIPLVHHVASINLLGYEPVIIISHRSFHEYARSVSVSRAPWTMPALIDRYIETYSTAILQLGLYGGCAIHYDEITSPEETLWASSIEALSHLSARDLLAAREERVDTSIASKRRPRPLLDASRLDPRIALVENTLLELKGRVLSRP